MNVMELRGVTKDYGRGRGVFDLSLTIAQGDSLGYLGPNGAGKTTTIRQMMGFTRPGKGTVRVFGKDPFGCARGAETHRVSARRDGVPGRHDR